MCPVAFLLGANRGVGSVGGGATFQGAKVAREWAEAHWHSWRAAHFFTDF